MSDFMTMVAATTKSAFSATPFVFVSCSSIGERVIAISEASPRPPTNTPIVLPSE